MAKEVITVTMDKEFHELLMANVPQGGGSHDITISFKNYSSGEVIKEMTVEIPTDASIWSDFINSFVPPTGGGFYYIDDEDFGEYMVAFADENGKGGYLLYDDEESNYIKLRDTIRYDVGYKIILD